MDFLKAIAGLSLLIPLGSTPSVAPEPNPAENFTNLIEQVEQPPEPEPKPEKKWNELTSIEKIKLNPKKCDLNTQWLMAHDGSCEDKAVPATPVAAPTQATDAMTGSGSCGLVYNYSNWNAAIAYGICMAESGGNPNAANWSDDHSSWAGCMGSFGLMQINCSNGQTYDGAVNMRIANQMWQASGFYPWTTYTSGKYLQYMP